MTVPDGFTGTALQLPHTVGGVVYLHLRDDPLPIDPATVSLAATTSTHTHTPHPLKARTNTPTEPVAAESPTPQR